MNTTQLDKVGKYSSEHPPAGQGHNKPPSDIEVALEKLPRVSKDSVKRFHDLLAAEARMPETCENETTATMLASYASQLKGGQALLENERKIQKAPYDALVAAVHGFYVDKKNILAGIENKVLSLLAVWNRKERDRKDALAAEEKKKQDEIAEQQRIAAKKLADDAQVLADAGLTTAADKKMAEAVQVETTAHYNAQEAAKPVESAKMTTRGTVGGSVGFKEVWKARITDIKKLDYAQVGKYCTVNELTAASQRLAKDLLKGVAITAEAPKVDGMEFYKELDSTVRKS